MFSVLFEVNRKPGREGDYLSLAQHLKPILERVDGFIDNERFESKRRPGWLLSHSTWRDERSVVRWRSMGEHHRVQQKGRREIFQDYHLRVGDVICDTDPSVTAPIREVGLDMTEVGKSRYMSFVEITPQEGAAVPIRARELATDLATLADSPEVAEVDFWASIYTPGKLAVTAGWRTEEAARTWMPATSDVLWSVRRRIVRIVRDYSMRDRREAPQFHEEVS